MQAGDRAYFALALTHPLENPIWNSLATRHRAYADGAGPVWRYRPEVAPFAGVPTGEPSDLAGLETLVQPGERTCMLNVMPEFRERWSLANEFLALQYIWDSAPPEVDPESRVLGDAHVPAMLELTALVYPAYFRAGTARLGTYVGFFEAGRLCAMAGIRMAMPGFQEISAVCTHPDYRGQGLAGRLSRTLIAKILGEGDVPFLHTESDNEPAQHVYERLGFRLRAQYPCRVLERR